MALLEFENSTYSNLVDQNASWMPVENSIPPAFMYWYYAMRHVCGVLAILGNSLTILAVLRFEHLRSNSTALLIASLGFADLLSGLLPPLVTLVYVFNKQEDIWKALCLTDLIINIMSSGGNMVNNIWIAVDRYIYISTPMRYYSILTTRRVIGIIIFTWVYVITQALTVYLTGSRLVPGKPCRPSVALPTVYCIPFLYVQSFTYYAIVIGLYSRIACIAAHQRRAVAQMDATAERLRNDRRSVAANSNQADDGSENNVRDQGRLRVKNEQKITKMMGRVLLVYFVVNLPQSFMSMVSAVYTSTAILIFERVGHI